MRKPCCGRDHKEQEINKGPWSKQEDEKLVEYIRTHGEGCWRALAQATGIRRCSKSCRLRWINYLRPDLERSNFGEDEEDLIIRLHALLGNRWSLIAGRLPGRTENEVKNYWNSCLKTKLMNMGIDPNNHCLNDIIMNIDHQPRNSPRVSTSNPKGEDPHDHISDVGSSLDKDEDQYALPDLNLDLTVDTVTPACSG